MSHRSLVVPAMVAMLALLEPVASAASPTGAAPAEDLAARVRLGDVTRVLDASALSGMDALLDQLADRRVVLVGEQHDRYEDHLTQLAIIQGLHARGKTLAIGMEFFQQPFQAALDDYIEGRIEEPELLRRTQYFNRWGFDYRLYRPILSFAREHRIPLIALNLETELTRKVGDVGINGLSKAERARIPAQIDRDDPAYRARIESVFKHHPADQRRNFEHFLEVQLLWDEGMAERAARALVEHPKRTLVVLAGAGHLEQGQGIPRRLLRRQPVRSAIVLNGQGRVPDPAVADFFLYPPPVALPPSGMLGVQLGREGDGSGVAVAGFADGSGAKAAGLQVGDRIVRIGAQSIASYADIRISLLDAAPGTTVSIEVVRGRVIGTGEHRSFQVELR